MDPLIAWEQSCRRCGLCCFEKVIEENGRIRTTTVACRYLDIVTRECKVYAKRQAVESTCVKLTPEIVATVDWLPEECAYRKGQVSRLRSGKD